MIQRSNAVPKKSNQFPTTVQESVRLLQGLVTADEQEKIALLNQDELITLHFGLGQWIRNNLGLWGDNHALLASTGETNADNVSGVIIHAF